MHNNVHTIVLNKEVPTAVFHRAFRRHVTSLNDAQTDKSKYEEYWVGTVSEDGRFQLGYHRPKESKTHVADKTTLSKNSASRTDIRSTVLNISGKFYTEHGKSAIQYTCITENPLNAKTFFALVLPYFAPLLLVAFMFLFVLPAEYRALPFIGAALVSLIAGGIEFERHAQFKRELSSLLGAIAYDCEHPPKSED